MEELVKFALVGIRTGQFSKFEENLSEGEGVSLKTDLQFKCNNNEKRIGAFTAFTFNQSKRIILKVQVGCNFEIASKSWARLLSKDKLTLPKDCAIHLAMLTIGATRGVLHAKTENSAFNKIFLPTIDVTKLVKGNIEFDLLRLL